MMYPYVTIDEDTEVTFSEPRTINGKESILVRVETARDWGFNTIECYIPQIEETWKNSGYSTEQERDWKNFIINNASIIKEASENGGILIA